MSKLSLLFSLLFLITNFAQSQSSLWLKNNKNESYVFNYENFKQLTESTSAFNKSLTIEFPDGRGNVDNYQVVETQTMHPKLKEKFPNIKTYTGASKNKRISFTFNEDIGINGIILSKNNKTKITPLTNSKHRFAIIHEGSFTEMECNTINNVQSTLAFGNTTARDINDSALRKYRLALSVSGEYSQSFLDGSESNNRERIDKVMTAIVNSVNRLNGIFEVDLGIRLELVANNDQIVFLDGFSDPYSTGDGLNNELQFELDNTIGNANYDVGHLYHREPEIYGNAGCIACVCTPGQKGSGFTVHSDPTSDGINIIAAHEFGHQFGAYHTQSSRRCRSGLNSEVEPGSGSTIMSYAGICGPNVQLLADDYFNYTSIRDIANWTINNSTCAEMVNIQNTAPIVNAGVDRVIPISTAFVVDAEASDVDNDLLTYCWEQNDNEDIFSESTPFSNQTVGPIFRSFPPSNSSKRYFPSLNDVVNGNLSPTWEVIPSVSRDINLIITVRDNNAQGGQVSSDAVRITTTDNAGPFIVTSQNIAGEVWTVGSEITVTWDVANTNSSPINTEEVEILLSTNGGQSFDNSLITTINDGSETFVLPNVDATNEARIMVKASDNIFYALNSQNFIIEKSEFIITANQSSLLSCNTSEVIFDLEYTTFLEFQETVDLRIVNLPESITQTFSKSIFSGANPNGESFTLTLSSLNSVVENNYTFSVIGLSNESGIEKELELILRTFDTNFTTPTTLTPLNEQDSINNENILFEWSDLNDAESYTIEIATNTNFNPLIISEISEEPSFITNDLEKDTTYYWRVNYTNSCGTSNYSSISSFRTACTAPDTILVENVTVSSAEISWNQELLSTWQIEYGVQGFVLGTGETLTTTESNLLLDNLNSETVYDIYLKRSCSSGGFSNPSNVAMFTTLSDFCNGDKFYDSGGQDGQYENNEFVTTTISPSNPSDRVTVFFESFSLESGFDFLSVYEGTTTNQQLGVFSGNSLQGQTISSSDESGALTFVFDSDGSVIFDGWVATVICEPRPNCLPPLNFSARAVGGTEAVFDWLAQGTDSRWELEYGLQGFTPGTGVTAIADQNEIEIENLQHSSSYDIYVKTICDIGGFSETIGPINFITRERCPAPETIIFSNSRFTSILADWDDLGADIWNLEYGESGFLPGEGINFELTESQLNIENLNSGTVYDVYLTANCPGGFSSNRLGPIQFETPLNFCEEGKFYDSGGEFGNYSNGENTTTTIVPNVDGERVRVVFNTFNLETCCDRLLIYNGPISNSNLIGSFSSLNDNNRTFISTHHSGILTFTFISDSSVTSSGWEANVFCEPQSNCPPLQDLTINTVGINDVNISVDLQNETEWELEYGLSGFLNGEGTVLNFNNQTVNLENLTPNTAYQIYARSVCSEGGFSNFIGPFDFTTEAPCSTPSNLRNTLRSKSSLAVDWSDLISDNWEIEFGLSGFTLGTGQQLTSTTTEVLINNLNINTAYDIYVRSVCSESDKSDYVSLLNVRTTPDFCNTGIFVDSGGEFGDYSNNEDLTTVIEPDNDSEFVKVTFNQFNIESGFDFMSVYDSNTTSSGFIGSFSGEELLNISFEATNNSGALTFVFTSDQIVPSLGWSASVVCETINTCSVPETIQIASNEATSIFATWQDNSSNTSWEVQYGELGFSLGSGTITQVMETQITLNDLQEATSYDIYVRGNCNINEVSDWFGPISFTTICNFTANKNELIKNGSFECGSLSGWMASDDFDDNNCRISFSVRQNSFDICTIVDDIFPSEGNFASFLSFDGQANDEFTLSQSFVIPDDDVILNEANFSFDFKVNYEIFSLALPRTLTTSIFINSRELILDTQAFGDNLGINRIDTSVDVDVLEILNNNKGKSATLVFKAFIPESFTGPSKAMIDNVSLQIVKENVINTPIITPINDIENDDKTEEIIENPLVSEDPIDANITVMPNPSNGEFNIVSEENIPTVEVYAIGGVLVRKITPQGNSKKVDLRDLPSGLYILKITRSSGSSEIKKLIIN